MQRTEENLGISMTNIHMIHFLDYE